jgi:acyl-CoA reductase-like NAD-dependent aldehyde dehydrogenase
MQLTELRSAIDRFNANGQLGEDPLARLYSERRASYTLFSRGLNPAEVEALRPYVFPWSTLPSAPGDAPIRVHNLIDGIWHAPTRGEYARLKSLADDRIDLLELPASTAEDVELAVGAADRAWKSLAWADETLAYRKWVVKNFSRLLDHYTEECLHEIRQQIPKTRLEAQKDFFEAKRAADHLEGNAETAMRGEMVPPMVPGQTYWRDSYLPAGVAALITPMNFIWGIPGIQVIGAYMSGCPFIYKGHPFSAITNTTLIRMLIAAGADPRFVHKLEGFGKGISTLASDERVAVVSVTGSSETARTISEARGLKRTRFEGGGCNWVYVDDGYSNEELARIAERLTYAKLGFSSHKCTSLHGIAARRETLDKLNSLVAAEMGRWQVSDPRASEATKVLGPIMVHQARTALDVVKSAEAAGAKVHFRNSRATDEYGQHAQAVTPGFIEVTPELEVTCDWDGKGAKTFRPATTEFFMPVLCSMALPDFEAFIRFSMFQNPHDLATAIYTRDDWKLHRARRILGGMLKENDGTDSALEWEEFGASTIGESGNMGVGEAQSTLSIFCRRQKGRHLVF